MKTAFLIVFPLVASLTVWADFSYTTIRKATGGASVAGNTSQTSRYYFKGRKLKVETGDSAVILDFGASTITSLDHKRKTISVSTFTPADSAVAGIDISETGNKKTVRGFRSSEVILKTELDSPELRTMGSKLQMEMDVWISRDVPGAAESGRFYEKNREDLPVLAFTAKGNLAVEKAIAALQHRIAAMNGVPVLETVTVKPADRAPAKPLSVAESGRIRDTIAELDAKVQRGGPDASAATQEMSRLKAMVGDDLVTGPLFEITMESTGFSTAAIPESVFAIPRDYQTVEPAR